MIEQLTGDLIRDEGLRLKPYKDTVGKLTIGIGRNLDDVGITENEARYLLENDIGVAMSELDREALWWRDLPEPAQRGLVNMCFNLGWPRLSKFMGMLGALEAGDYHSAAEEALDSRWSAQVGDRARRIADLYRSCA
jgi:lysozyme